MADFVSEDSPATEPVTLDVDHEKGEPVIEVSMSNGKIDVNNPVRVLYCAICSMPPEFCEYGACYDQCLPWIRENCPEILGEGALTEAMGKASIEGDADAEEGEEKKKKKSKGSGAAAPKKSASMETKIVISKIQRQKKKFVTVVTGLETVPDLKVKDAARVFGKKFSSGASVNDLPTGGKEVVIQGDMTLELPNVIISEFKVS